MDTVYVILHGLNALEYAEATIPETLTKLNCLGVVHSTKGCPVAVWLSHYSGLKKEFMDVTDTLVYYQERNELNTRPLIVVPIPPRVQAFIRHFDNGKFPDLVTR